MDNQVGVSISRLLIHKLNVFLERVEEVFKSKMYFSLFFHGFDNLEKNSGYIYLLRKKPLYVNTRIRKLPVMHS